jgi:hypothetical protein
VVQIPPAPDARLCGQYSVFADWNSDGDFDDPDEDRDLLATAPGRILYHTASYDNLKVRLSNHSCGLMTVKQVTVYERYTHTLLQQAIAAAQTLHDQAVEGTENGQYPVGSKATLASRHRRGGGCGRRPGGHAVRNWMRPVGRTGARR